MGDSIFWLKGINKNDFSLVSYKENRIFDFNCSQLKFFDPLAFNNAKIENGRCCFFDSEEKVGLMLIF